MGLTLKEDKFCLELVKCGNGTKAATIAGYSAKTARTIASKLLTKVDILERINELKANLADTVGINQVMIAHELKKIAFSNISDTRNSWLSLKDFKQLSDDHKTAIADIQYEIKKVGKASVKVVKIKMHNKLAAIQELNKMLGYNAPQKHELTGTNGKPLQQDTKHVVEFQDYSNDYSLDYDKLSDECLNEIIAAYDSAKIPHDKKVRLKGISANQV